jgi:hypothetical protein
MPQIEARSWWDDVQHLRPDAPAAPPAPLRLAEEAPAPAPARSRRVLLVTDDEPRHAPVATARAPRRAVELLEPLEDDADDLASRRAARRRPSHARDARPSGDLDFDFGRSAADRARRRTEARRQTSPAGTSIELTLSSSRELEPAGTGAGAPALAPLAQRAQALLPARRERAERPARAERGPRPTLSARMLATPEHFALYAVVLGILLVIVAASSGHS